MAGGVQEIVGQGGGRIGRWGWGWGCEVGVCGCVVKRAGQGEAWELARVMDQSGLIV